MIDFLLLYEGKARESESIILLKENLEDRGYSVQIENLFELQIFFNRKIKAKVVIVPFLYSNIDLYQNVYCICGTVQKVINLRWEQIFSTKNEKDLSSFGYPKDQAKKAYHICWSEYLRKLLIKSGVDESKSIVTGSIQMDFNTSRFDCMYLNKQEISKKYSIPLNCKWNLLVSSFAYASLSDKEISEMSIRVAPDVKRFTDISKKTRDELLKWIEHRLKDNSNEIWIYRPHPAERSDNKLIKFKSIYKNFYIISEESVRQWIKVSDKVINWYSTSCADVYFQNKASIIVRPYKLYEERELVLLKDQDFIENEEDFNLVCNQNDYESINTNIEKYYDNGKELSVDKICNLCLKLYNGQIPDCNIDYGKVVSSIPVKIRFKSTIIYKTYASLMAEISKKASCWFLPTTMRSKLLEFKRDLENIASNDELKLIQEKIGQAYNNEGKQIIN